LFPWLALPALTLLFLWLAIWLLIKGHGAWTLPAVAIIGPSLKAFGGTLLVYLLFSLALMFRKSYRGA
jgi:hypothetical protein